MVMESLASLLYFYISVEILFFFLVLYSLFFSLMSYLRSAGGAKTFYLVVVPHSISP